MNLCDTCGNGGAILAPHTGKLLCDCCSTSLLIGPHECLSHPPAGSNKPAVIDVDRDISDAEARELKARWEPSEFCTCTNYTGTERNTLGVKVCERCGKPDDPRDERTVYA